jgi:hypothetical protein
MYCHIRFYLFTTCFDLSRGHHQIIPHYKTYSKTNMNSDCLQVIYYIYYVVLTVPLFQIVNTQQDAKHQNNLNCNKFCWWNDITTSM